MNNELIPKMPTKQTGKDAAWNDEKGTAIPYNRTTAYERKAEHNAHLLLKGAISLSTALASYKEKVREIHNEMVAAFSAEKGVDLSKGKGNHVWYNFDRSIKVSADAQERIEFDDLTISAAREKFNAFLADAIQTNEAFVRDLIQDAFETTNGKLDPKRIIGLTRYKKKVKNTLFLEAIELIEESIRRNYSKTYFNIYVRNQETGAYDSVKLDFAAL